MLGICNGFQVLCESHLLPGALIRNDVRTFVCRDQRLRVESVDTVWTCAFDAGQEITIVLKNGEGGFVADPDTIARLEGENQVVFRYLDDNPNGSLNDIAGITNARGNVVGLMPHPEHNMEELTSPSLDGRTFFASLERLPAPPPFARLPGALIRGASAPSRAAAWGGLPLMRPPVNGRDPSRRRPTRSIGRLIGGRPIVAGDG